MNQDIVHTSVRIGVAESKFQIISEIDAISMIVEYNNIKCSRIWYHFDLVTVYYKEKTISNPNSDTGMNYVLVH
jgi:hypothetical protein